MKGSRRWQAWDRRTGGWIPPNLTRFGSPVFGPVAEPQAPVPAPPMPIDLSEIPRDVLRQVLMTPLVSGPELARALERDEAVVLEAAQALQQEGLLRSISFGCLLRPTARYWLRRCTSIPPPWSDLEQALLSWHSDAGIGSLLRYSLPRIESINQVAVRYVVDGWALEGVAWAERDAVQAIGFYNWKQFTAGQKPGLFCVGVAVGYGTRDLGAADRPARSGQPHNPARPFWLSCFDRLRPVGGGKGSPHGRGEPERRRRLSRQTWQRGPMPRAGRLPAGRPCWTALPSASGQPWPRSS